jgi:hypothetical protein
MVYRTVSKSEAATPELACALLRQETGGQVQRAQGFDVIDEGDYWRIPVFSTDGRASMPFPVGAVFPNDNRMSNAEIEKQINQFGNSELKERREFDSAGGDGPGWELGRATGPGFSK